MKKIRLSKALQQAGVAARRKCEQIIFDGRVEVNGQRELLPQTHVDPKTDLITIDKKELPDFQHKLYFVLNKPKGYLCTNKREKNKRIVLDLFRAVGQSLFTVGRLDKDTSGLLIVTNDGQFANEVIHPSSDIEKEYLVKVTEEVTDKHLKALSAGTVVEGVHVKPVKVKKARRGTIKIVIKEGKKREVRLLCKDAGLNVRELSRIRIGQLRLGNLPLGYYRSLSEGEKDSIFL